MSDLKVIAEQAIRAAARTHRGIIYRDYGPEAEWVLSTIEPDIRADERAKVFAEIIQSLAPYLSTPLYRIYGAGGGMGTGGAVAVTLGDVLRSRQESAK